MYEFGSLDQGTGNSEARAQYALTPTHICMHACIHIHISQVPMQLWSNTPSTRSHTHNIYTYIHIHISQALMPLWSNRPSTRSTMISPPCETRLGRPRCCSRLWMLSSRSSKILPGYVCIMYVYMYVCTYVCTSDIVIFGCFQAEARGALPGYVHLYALHAGLLAQVNSAHIA
jgi:hypothetical protein